MRGVWKGPPAMTTERAGPTFPPTVAANPRPRVAPFPRDGRLEPVAGALDRVHFNTELKWEAHLLRVALLVIGDLVLVGERVVALRERDPWQTVEVARREEPQ